MACWTLAADSPPLGVMMKRKIIAPKALVNRSKKDRLNSEFDLLAIRHGFNASLIPSLHLCVEKLEVRKKVFRLPISRIGLSESLVSTLAYP